MFSVSTRRNQRLHCAGGRVPSISVLTLLDNNLNAGGVLTGSELHLLQLLDIATPTILRDKSFLGMRPRRRQLKTCRLCCRMNPGRTPLDTDQKQWLVTSFGSHQPLNRLQAQRERPAAPVRPRCAGGVRPPSVVARTAIHVIIAESRIGRCCGRRFIHCQFFFPLESL